MEKLISFIEAKADSYGLFFVFGGAIGAIIVAIWKKMSWKMVLSTIIVSMFVGWVTGIVLRNIFDVSPDMIYALSSTAGAFSYNILAQLEKIISNLGSVVNKKLEN